MVTILFPRKGDRLRAHSVFFQALRVAASGIGVMTGMVPVRSSATAIAVPAGTYRSLNVVGAYAGGSLTSVPAASSGKQIEERRVGKECLRLCRSRWSPYH